MSKQNWYNSLSNDVDYRSVKKLIIVSSLSLLIYGILYFIGYIDGIPFAFALICVFIYLPATLILPILFGFYSYAITKRIVLPNLILFFSYIIFIGVFIHFIISALENESYSIYMFLDALPLALIVTSLSLVTSLVAMWDYKSLKKKSAKATTEDSYYKTDDVSMS